MAHALIYPNEGSLRPLKRLLEDTAQALNDPSFHLKDTEIPAIAAAAGGAGAGAAAGAGILAASAATGTSGAAALTSGLATAGAIIGGGMTAGIAVIAAPAVVFGIGGYVLVTRWNRKRLEQEKEALLQAALLKHDAVLRQLKAEAGTNAARLRSLQALVIQLEAAIKNLKGDLVKEAA